jgi:hypothetical protein
MGWAADKLRSAYVWMAVKELRWDLDEADDFRRAEILVYAHKMRIEVLEASGIPREVMATPRKFPREYLMSIASQLQDTIYDGGKISRRAMNYAKSLGMDAKLTSQQEKLQRRALQVWVATLGGNANSAGDIERIWELLRSSRHQVPRVVDRNEALDKAMIGGLDFDREFIEGFDKEMVERFEKEQAALLESQNRYSRDQLIEMCKLFPTLRGT